MSLRRTIRRMNIMVGTAVAVVVFVLSVTGVVLTYELGFNARAQGAGRRGSHSGLDTEPLAGRGRYGAPEPASTLILHCEQSPCSSREQMLSMAAAHLDVPYWTLADAIDSLSARRARAARR